MVGSCIQVTVADRIRALNARILAGDGPDILVLDGLPTESYIEKGILADLNPLLGDLKEELLPSVLSAYTETWISSFLIRSDPSRLFYCLFGFAQSFC